MNDILSSPDRNLDELSCSIKDYRENCGDINSEFNRNVLQTLEDLKEMVAFMRESEPAGYSEDSRDPDELAPRAKSLQNLREAWMLLVPGKFVYPEDSIPLENLLWTFSTAASEYSLSCDILNAHIDNLKLVKSKDYEKCCLDAVLCGCLSPPPVARGSSSDSPPNPGFLLSMYNPAVLPFFGTAVTVAAAATVTLGASLYARFFAKPDDHTGGSGSSMTHSGRPLRA